MDENNAPQDPQGESIKPENVVSLNDDGALNDTNDLKFQNRLDLSELQQSVEKIKQEVGKVIVGQKDMVDMLIASLLAKGNHYRKTFS